MRELRIYGRVPPNVKQFDSSYGMVIDENSPHFTLGVRVFLVAADSGVVR